MPACPLSFLMSASVSINCKHSISCVLSVGQWWILVCLLPLGKAHGSLARAGKVRGQTPKVRAHIHTCTFVHTHACTCTFVHTHIQFYFLYI